MRKTVLFLFAAFLGFLPLSSFAADSSKASPDAVFTDKQRTEIESIIKKYITEKNPEVLSEGLRTLQKREQDESESKIKVKLVSEKDKLFNDPATPTAGNPSAKIYVVEFYDYQCGYCKAAEESLERLVKEQKDVKFVFKNYPVLGAVSTEAAKAGLAAAKQGKFYAFHSALMTKKGHFSSEDIYQVAQEAGLDVDKLKKDMSDKSVEEELNAGLKLGNDIGVRGTPFFVVNDAFFPGVVQYDELKKAIDNASKK
jgi:protein-disulfide isomerase